MREAADYVSQMPRQKKVIIFGDEDIDGVTSSIIIKESFERLGFSEVKNLFCLYEKEGHGFSLGALDFIVNEAPALIVLVDLGISNNESVAEARRLGFEVIIIDHHEPLSEELPPANFIINPKQPSDEHEFKNFAAAGLCYHFSRWLLQADSDFDLLDERFVELAGLATLADMMPLDEANTAIVSRMIDNLPRTTQPALRVLLERYLVDGKTLREAIHRMIMVMNASQVSGDRMAELFLLLAGDRPHQTDKMIDVLEKRASDYILLREAITGEAEQRLNEEGLAEIIFIGEEEWPRRALASVAARLADTYQRPAFVYVQGENVSRGSVRSPEGIDCVALLSACSDYLTNYGGHPPAAGFEVKNEDLQKLRLCLIENYRKLYG